MTPQLIAISRCCPAHQQEGSRWLIVCHRRSSRRRYTMTPANSTHEIWQPPGEAVPAVIVGSPTGGGASTPSEARSDSGRVQAYPCLDSTGRAADHTAGPLPGELRHTDASTRPAGPWTTPQDRFRATVRTGVIFFRLELSGCWGRGPGARARARARCLWTPTRRDSGK